MLVKECEKIYFFSTNRITSVEKTGQLKGYRYFLMPGNKRKIKLYFEEKQNFIFYLSVKMVNDAVLIANKRGWKKIYIDLVIDSSNCKQVRIKNMSQLVYSLRNYI